MTGHEMVKLLEQHGWVEARHTKHKIMKKGGRIIPVPVHGKKELPKGTEDSILKMAGLK